MKLQYIVISLLFWGCQSNAIHCFLTSKDLVNANLGKVFISDKNKGHITLVNDKGIDSIKGGVYFFASNDELQSYKFFENMKAFTYDEEFNTSGELVRSVGKPLVDTKVREVNADSAFLRLYFFSLHKTYQKLNISVNDTLKFYLDLQDDTLYTNMKIASFGLNTKMLRQLNMYFSIDYRNECTNQPFTLKDTLLLVKNPKLNFVKGGSKAMVY